MKDTESTHIPSSYTLGGIVVKVKHVEVLDKGATLGSYDNILNTIKIASLVPNVEQVQGIPAQNKELTFYHELVHSILFAMGHSPESEVNLNETFVEGFASYLYQFVKSAKYGNQRSK